MNKVVTFQSNDHQMVTNSHFNNDQIQILKNSICKGVSDEEFKIFLMACAKTQLDPFMRQIYAVKRKQKKPDGSWAETMTIQTGIDGYRLIAERTGCYAPGVEPTYNYDAEGRLMSATAYIKKQTSDGTWHTISASAYLDEYCQTFTNKNTGEKVPMGMWATMPRTMLSKCAESQALRKAFPAEMSGVYTKEEMQQAEDCTPKITLEQVSELNMILSECSLDYVKLVYKYLMREFKTEDLCELPASLYDKLKDAAVKNMHENLSKTRIVTLQEETEEKAE